MCKQTQTLHNDESLQYYNLDCILMLASLGLALASFDYFINLGVVLHSQPIENDNANQPHH